MKELEKNKITQEKKKKKTKSLFPIITVRITAESNEKINLCFICSTRDEK